jgi:hypothetical protein
MNRRENMGIELPETSADDCIIISVPKAADTTTTNSDVRIAAWQTIERYHEDSITQDAGEKPGENEYLQTLPPVLDPHKQIQASSEVISEVVSEVVSEVISSLDHLIDVAFDESTVPVCSYLGCAFTASEQTEYTSGRRQARRYIKRTASSSRSACCGDRLLRGSPCC